MTGVVVSDLSAGAGLCESVCDWWSNGSVANRAWKCGPSFLECAFGLWALILAATIKALNKVYSKCVITKDYEQEDSEPRVFMATFYTSKVYTVFFEKFK